MTTTNITAFFHHADDAKAAITEVKTHGFVGEYAVDIVLREPTAQTHAQRLTPPAGPMQCALITALAGGLAGFLALLGLLGIPGLDLGFLLAGGPVVALLLAALIGAAAGGVVGGLLGVGMSKQESEIHQGGNFGDGALVSIGVAEEYARHIAAILTGHGGTYTDRALADWKAAGWKPLATSNIPPRSAEPEPMADDVETPMLHGTASLPQANIPPARH